MQNNFTAYDARRVLAQKVASEREQREREQAISEREQREQVQRERIRQAIAISREKEACESNHKQASAAERERVTIKQPKQIAIAYAQHFVKDAGKQTPISKSKFEAIIRVSNGANVLVEWRNKRGQLCATIERLEFSNTPQAQTSRSVQSKRDAKPKLRKHIAPSEKFHERNVKGASLHIDNAPSVKGIKFKPMTKAEITGRA